MLAQRNEKEQNDLDKYNNPKLDKIDKFISIIVRLETFEKRVFMTRGQRALARKLILSKFWKNKISARQELMTYANNHWERAEIAWPKIPANEVRFSYEWIRERAYIWW